MKQYLAILTFAVFSSANSGWAEDFSYVLTDVDKGLNVANWQINSGDLDVGSKDEEWSVTKRTLEGGKQDGVEVIEVFNGTMSFTVVPTRGFNIWEANLGDLRFGWDSPVKEIVHPKFVELGDRGGLGWLNGFGEWLSRCGLESNGAPGQDGNQFLNLHGRINYIPASYVEVEIQDGPSPKIVLKGVVDETLMFGPQLRLNAEISTAIGSNTLTLNDEVINLADKPQEMESLYHINFGAPLLEAGAEFVAPVKTMHPRDPRAAEGDITQWAKYTGPHGPEYTEQVYLMELQADEAGNTETLLKSADGSRAASVRFNTAELPYMTLWKNEGPAKAGYVTGLEPATNFPYPRAIERDAGRVPLLQGGDSYRSSVTIEALTTSEQVEAALERIAKLQEAAPKVFDKPLVQ